MVVYLS